MLKNNLIPVFALFLGGASLIMIASGRIGEEGRRHQAVSNPLSLIEIASTSIRVEIAEDQSERSRGLSGRESLASGEGMLFVFAKPDFYYFWMKEMSFPLDIIWINEEKKVIDLTEDLEPETFPQTVTSRLPAKYVLEVNSGFIKQHQVKVGDELHFK